MHSHVAHSEVRTYSMRCFHGNNIPTGVASSSHSHPLSLTLHGGPDPQGGPKTGPRTAVALSVPGQMLAPQKTPT